MGGKRFLEKYLENINARFTGGKQGEMAKNGQNPKSKIRVRRMATWDAKRPHGEHAPNGRGSNKSDFGMRRKHPEQLPGHRPGLHRIDGPAVGQCGDLAQFTLFAGRGNNRRQPKRRQATALHRNSRITPPPL